MKKNKREYNYNRLEKQRSYKIHDLKTIQSRLFNRWHDIDLKINLLKKEMNGKYIERKVMVPHLLTKEG